LLQWGRQAIKRRTVALVVAAELILAAGNTSAEHIKNALSRPGSDASSGGRDRTHAARATDRRCRSV
jgi:hypothetical protein